MPFWSAGLRVRAVRCVSVTGNAITEFLRVLAYARRRGNARACITRSDLRATDLHFPLLARGTARAFLARRNRRESNHERPCFTHRHTFRLDCVAIAGPPARSQNAPSCLVRGRHRTRPARVRLAGIP